MNNKGFTLTEFLGCLALLMIVFIIGLCSSRAKLAASLSMFRAVNDDEVFYAAREYANDNTELYNEYNYMCVMVDELMKDDYLARSTDNSVINKTVKVTRGSQTKKIKSIKYVNKCN